MVFSMKILGDRGYRGPSKGYFGINIYIYTYAGFRVYYLGFRPKIWIMVEWGATVGSPTYGKLPNG